MPCFTPNLFTANQQPYSWTFLNLQRSDSMSINYTLNNSDDESELLHTTNKFCFTGRQVLSSHFSEMFCVKTREERSLKNCAAARGYKNTFNSFYCPRYTTRKLCLPHLSIAIYSTAARPSFHSIHFSERIISNGVAWCMTFLPDVYPCFPLPLSTLNWEIFSIENESFRHFWKERAWAFTKSLLKEKA